MRSTFTIKKLMKKQSKKLGLVWKQLQIKMKNYSTNLAPVHKHDKIQDQ